MKQGFTIIEFMVYAVVLAMLGGVAAVGLLPSRWARAEGAATFALAFDGDDTRITTGAAWMWGDWRIETALGWMTVPSAQYFASGEVPRRIGSEAAMVVPYKAFRTSDGYLVIAAGNDKLFAGLSAAIGLPELPDDPRFRGNPKRVENRVALNAIIEERIATRSRADWTAALEAAGVPCAPLQDTAEVVAHPQTIALGMLQSLPGSALTLMGLPVSFAGRRPPLRRLPPPYGRDDDVLGPLAAPSEAT